MLQRDRSLGQIKMGRDMDCKSSVPSLECDVVMKGGITSGVVYPKALLQLKDKFRFRSIGGASAGAIAAAVAAAAELGRDRGGFDRVAMIPDEMAKHLGDLFQPWPKLRALHRVFVAIAQGGLIAAIWPILSGYWPWTLGGVAIGVLVALLAAWVGAPTAFTLVMGLIVVVLGALALPACALYSDVMKRLPEHDFGLCPGRTQLGVPFDAFSDWLSTVIEESAGHEGPFQSGHSPVTFGDLAAASPSITLRVMTTNLSLGLGHVLPSLGDGNYFWKEEEMRRLLPDWIVDYMARTGGEPDNRSGLRKFPSPDLLPVVLGVRMSLSFPVLIAAVPLYRIDFAENLPEGEEAKPKRVLFSDGGISSNFPVQFFDALLPSRPTFGISLDEYDESRKERRVHLPMKVTDTNWFPIGSCRSLTAFAMSVLNTAKDWQDRRLAGLSGYRERIVHIYLKETEGGLNLKMEPTTIAALADFGDRAGALMASQPRSGDLAAFDFNDHRWRRFLIAYYQIEQLLEELREGWGDLADPSSFAAAISELIDAPPSYKGSAKAWRQQVWNRMDALIAEARENFEPPLRHQEGAIPTHKARLQIVPEA
ncbi:RpoH suppressor [Mesorhizobium sp. LSJC269B00]|nr:RpoH suppressor [Mesorhizobium sp. LSJC269B00]